MKTEVPIKALCLSFSILKISWNCSERAYYSFMNKLNRTESTVSWTFGLLDKTRLKILNRKVTNLNKGLISKLFLGKWITPFLY